MSGPFQWWANRKSKNGLRPLAKAPPHLPNGKEWWTEPPTALPQPEYIEYVSQFMAQVLSQPGSNERNAMMKHLANWMSAARRLFHEEWHLKQHTDLATTDGILEATSRALGTMCRIAVEAGREVPPEVQRVKDALSRRADKIRRERAIESSKRTQRPTRPDAVEREP